MAYIQPEEDDEFEFELAEDVLFSFKSTLLAERNALSVFFLI